MPTQLVSVQSGQSTLAGVVPGEGLVPGGFVLRRGYEGPQVIIEWDEPTEALSLTTLVLVRRLFGFPQNETDGDIIYTGPPTAQLIADLNVEPCRCYYYRVFSITLTGAVLFSTEAEGFIIPLETGFFAEKLWQLQPELYKNRDKNKSRDGVGKLALTEGPGSGHPEVFNLGEDGSILKGQLRRFLKLWGPMFDEPKALLDCLLNQLDVDESCLPNLEHLAALLGLNLNKELSPEQFRNEVRLQVEFLKLKGTKPGLLARIRSVSGLTGVIREQCDDILITNDIDKTTVKFTPAEIASQNGPDDEFFYSVGYYDDSAENPQPPFWLWFTLFMDITGQGVNEVTLRKWCLAVDESSPTCHRGFIRLVTSEDDALAVTFTEDPLSTIDLEDDEALDPDFVDVILLDAQVPDASLWLLTSDPLFLTNAPNWTAVTAAPTIP